MNSDSRNTPIEVFIAGAGPTGMLLALLLARDGVGVRIVDSNAGRVKESRAMAIHAKTMELFQSLGLVNQFLDRGLPTKGLTIYLDGKSVANVEFAGIGRDDTPYPYVFSLSQSVTEEILEKALLEAGVTIERQTTLVDFEQNNSDITIRLQRPDGTTEKALAKYLVGCDGARSQVRKSSGLSFAGGTYEQEFMLTDAKVVWDLPHDRFQIFIGTDTIALFFPLKGSEYSRIIHIGKSTESTQEAEEHLTTQIPLQFTDIQEKFQKIVGRKLTLENPLWLTRYRVHHRSVEKMRTGKIFLAGDAAHIHSPAGGQGMNTGLQDAANLAWKLSAVLQGKASDELLETYNSERWRVGQKLLHFTDRIFSAVSSFNPATKLFIHAAFPIIGKIISAGFQPRFMFNFISQLNIHYHASPVVSDKFLRPREKALTSAGRRAPDAPLLDGRTLFDLIKGYRFNVLVMSTKTISAADRLQFENSWRRQKSLAADAPIYWIDATVSPVALKRYDVQDILVTMIRPDGYIGYQSDEFYL